MQSISKESEVMQCNGKQSEAKQRKAEAKQSNAKQASSPLTQANPHADTMNTTCDTFPPTPLALRMQFVPDL